jgi:predicted AlkP superfamily pyrophosphatase or phosphodiesterase
MFLQFPARTLLSVGLLACSATQSSAPATAHSASLANEQQVSRPARGTVQHVMVVTIDGLMPESYLHPQLHQLQVPNLARLVREGASSDGALSVFPTLTYPAHTSIATGTLPSQHGIVANLAFDPLELNQNAWRWYAEEVKVPTLWEVAREAGLQTAVLDWPVTVGDTANYHVPEFWRQSP